MSPDWPWEMGSIPTLLHTPQSNSQFHYKGFKMPLSSIDWGNHTILSIYHPSLYICFIFLILSFKLLCRSRVDCSSNQWSLHPDVGSSTWRGRGLAPPPQKKRTLWCRLDYLFVVIKPLYYLPLVRNWVDCNVSFIMHAVLHGSF